MSSATPRPPPRPDRIAALRNFQQRDLSRLRAELATLDASIAAAEADVLRATTAASAARALVCMRGGVLPSRADTPKPKQRLFATADGALVRHQRPTTPAPDLPLRPCGVAYTRFRKRFEAPRQSFTGAGSEARVLFVGARGEGEVSVEDRLWIVYWLDRNAGLWREFVRPPRAKGGWRVGLFATRSPNRPSPVGLSLGVVREVGEGGFVVGGVDILDETPVLGWRKYDALKEAHPGVRSGWVDEAEKLQPLYYDEMGEDGGVTPHVLVEDRAAERLAFIDEKSTVDVGAMVRETLRRIPIARTQIYTEQAQEDALVLASLPVGSFRVLYKLANASGAIRVYDVVSGMRRQVCEQEAETDPEAMLHRDFQQLFSHDSGDRTGGTL